MKFLPFLARKCRNKISSLRSQCRKMRLFWVILIHYVSPLYSLLFRQKILLFLQGFHISTKVKSAKKLWGHTIQCTAFTNRSISSSPPKSKVGKGALNSAVVYSSSTMMALAFCDACEMKKIPLQSWCSSQEDLAAHALLEEMNLESSQGVGRERRRLNDDNTLAPRKDHRQPQLILRKLTVLDPTHLLK